MWALHLPSRFSRLVSAAVTGAARVTPAKSPLTMIFLICIVVGDLKDKWFGWKMVGMIG